MSTNEKFPIPENDGAANHLEKSSIPSISLPNQEGNLLTQTHFQLKNLIFSESR